jgi:8-oxo-dGTP diphosphatase
MTHFVLGFIFSPDQQQLLLLKKRPTDRFNADRWNGIGGHIEPGETPAAAMSRECLEEAALEISEFAWFPVGKLSDQKSFTIDVFAGRADISQASQITDEELGVFDRSQVADLDLAADVDVMLGSWINGNSLIA